MLKLKLIYSSGILLVSCFTVCLPKAAAGDFAEFKMVAASGSTEDVLDNKFSLDQVPYLYVKAAEGATLGSLSRESTWQWLLSTTTYTVDTSYEDSIDSNGQEAWLAFNSTYWAEIVEEGDWRVTLNLSGYNGTTYFTVTSSPTVTPEPISSVLFLTGGAVLLLRKRRGVVTKDEKAVHGKCA